jgi:hypothetical protein
MSGATDPTFNGHYSVFSHSGTYEYIVCWFSAEKRNFATPPAIDFHGFALLEALPCVWPIACLSVVH